MATTTIRVSEATRERFARMAQISGRPMSRLVEDAADALERRLFFDELAAVYERLRTDQDVWGQIEAERAIESGALADRSS